jgi:hypothetical protein
MNVNTISLPIKARPTKQLLEGGVVHEVKLQITNCKWPTFVTCDLVDLAFKDSKVTWAEKRGQTFQSEPPIQFPRKWVDSQYTLQCKTHKNGVQFWHLLEAKPTTTNEMVDTWHPLSKTHMNWGNGWHPLEAKHGRTRITKLRKSKKLSL